ncbi:MAG TPA: hypothetical protein VNZ52_08220 [Candidatus Thermoplasmatota archaeon]|nr:hypothetical protein [Candidatus Thermoplasmatota archaeon]
MVDKLKIDRRGVHLRRTAKLAAGFWMLRRARRMSSLNPVALGVRFLGVRMLRGTMAAPRFLRRVRT